MPGVATIELSAAQKIADALEREIGTGSRKVRNAAVGALKRSLRSGRSQASTEIRQTIRLPKRIVDKYVRTRVISERSLVGKLFAFDRRTQLIEFMTRGQITKQIVAQRQFARGRGRRRGGVRIKAYKNRPAQVYSGTFIALLNNGRKPQVLKRRGRARLPIDIQYGPTLLSEFFKGFGAFAERVNDQLNKNMQNVLDRFAAGRL
jgi:hypothetical protein